MILTLVLLIFLKILQVCTLGYIPNEAQWIVWDLMLLITPVILSICLFKEISYRKNRAKIFVCLFLMLSLWETLDFLLLTFLEGADILNVTREVTGSMFILIFLPLLINLIARPNIADDPYTKTGSFLAYKHPRSLSGLLASLIESPHGHVSLVVKNKIFKYKEGYLIEAPHDNISSYVYKKIDKVDLKDARQLIGKKWSIRNNCFSTFNKITK